MDSKKIEALLLAVEKGSLSLAAEELGYTQSGLTHMMNSLEDELGLKLLIRSKSGVCLSPIGQALQNELKALVKAAGNLELSAQKLKKEDFSTLRLGAYSSVVRHWMPSVLAKFREDNPDTEVLMDAGNIREIYERTKADILDCAIVSYQAELINGLSWIPLREDKLVAILPKSYKSNEDVFPVRNFSGLEFIMPSACFDMDINPVFSTCGEKVTPRISYSNLDDAAIVSMVSHGLGVSILSELVMQDMRNRVSVLPLYPSASRSLGIIVSGKKQNDRNIKRFINCTRQVLKTMYDKK